MIELNNVSFRFIDEENDVLKNINLSVRQGEFISILGRNGSGKSTLARLFNGLLTPTSGSVTVLGMDTKNEDTLWNVRQSVGLVFQNPDNQIVAAVVEDDVAFGPENLGVLPVEIRRRVDWALHTVDMYEERLNAPHLLSGGQKQRIAIAGVLAMKPKCIVFDEPTAMLDPVGRKEVLETISKINREDHITIVLITHNMDEAVRSDRIIVLDDGCVAGDDSPERIFRDTELLMRCGLEVPMTVALQAGLRENGINIPDQGIRFAECVQSIISAYQGRNEV